MEAKKDGRNLLEKIRPPRLEDAGLEDCALPPDSIQEAFNKAADAVKSRAAALFDASDDDAKCSFVADPKLTVVVDGGAKPSGEAAREEECGDVVVAAGDGLKKGLGVAGIKEKQR